MNSSSFHGEPGEDSQRENPGRGQEGGTYFVHHEVPLFTQEVLLAADVSVGECFQLSRQITEGYLKGEYDAVKICYTRFDSMMTQTAATMEVPSACNSQPWSFLVINSPEKAAAVAASTQCAGFNKFTDNCPSFIAVCEEDAYLMGDPQHPNQKYADIDLGIAVAHLCYAAKQQGLSTCIMGAFDKKMLLEGLGITEEKRVRLVLSVGYAANDQLRTKKRKPLEQIMTYID